MRLPAKAAIKIKDGRLKVTDLPVPSEMEEQRRLIAWADNVAMLSPWWPAGAFLVHIPNGSYRGRGTVGILVGKRLRDMGLRAGFPDLGLFVPRSGYHGLFIEMKRTKGGQVEESQKGWHAELRARGYRVEVCKGCDAAIAAITDYLKGETSD